MSKNMSDYIDRFKLICVKQQSGELEGGDTCANEFTVLYSIYAQPIRPAEDEVEFGYKLACVYDHNNNRYRRHPDPAEWYSDPDRFSRDQMRPLMYFLNLPLKSSIVRWHCANLWLLHMRHGFLFTWNTRRNGVYKDPVYHAKRKPHKAWDYRWKMPDFTGPESWATWLRGAVNHCETWYQKALFSILLYPVLCILDLQILGTAFFRRVDFEKAKESGSLWESNGKAKWDHDQRNNALGIDFHTRHLPTPVSLLAKHIYGKETALTSFESWWGKQPWEPPINDYISKLYK